MVEIIKIKDDLYVDAEDFYEKVCKPRNVKTYSMNPNDSENPDSEHNLE
jgi:hypothetical protein